LKGVRTFFFVDLAWNDPTINDYYDLRLNEKDQCDALLLDFHKAFDEVPHALLFKKTSSLWNMWSALLMVN